MLALTDRLASGKVEHEDLAVVLKVEGFAATNRDVVGVSGGLERTAFPDDATIEPNPRHERWPLGMRGDDQGILRHNDGRRSAMISRPPAFAHARAHAHQVFAA